MAKVYINIASVQPQYNILHHGACFQSTIHMIIMINNVSIQFHLNQQDKWVNSSCSRSVALKKNSDGRHGSLLCENICTYYMFLSGFYETLVYNIIVHYYIIMPSSKKGGHTALLLSVCRSVGWSDTLTV